jgi:hypothetical protein
MGGRAAVAARSSIVRARADFSFASLIPGVSGAGRDSSSSEARIVWGAYPLARRVAGSIRRRQQRQRPVFQS